MNAAIRSAFCSAIAFGTSSPSTSPRYVRTVKEIRNARVRLMYGSRKCEINGSPIAPRRIENTVIPSCTVLMNRVGSSISRSAVAAPRTPRRRISASLVRRAVTSEYSATTNRAFPSKSRNTRKMRRPSLTPRFPGRVD